MYGDYELNLILGPILNLMQFNDFTSIYAHSHTHKIHYICTYTG